LIDASFYTPEAAARGTAIHAMTEAFDRRNHRASWAAAIEPYASAYDKFRRECQPRFSDIERMLCHVIERYAGRPDRVVVDLGGEAGILEIKSGSVEIWHGYQTALYQLMQPTGSRFVLYLNANGRYKLQRMTNADDYRIGRLAVRTAWKILENSANAVADNRRD
jgi:RecB family exonuclease